MNLYSNTIPSSLSTNPDNEGKGRDMEALKFTKKYLEDLRVITKSKHKTRIQEKMSEYMEEMRWENQTIVQDLQGLFVAAYTCVKRKTWDDFEKRLNWIRGKNLHPKQVMKVLYKP